MAEHMLSTEKALISSLTPKENKTTKDPRKKIPSFLLHVLDPWDKGTSAGLEKYEGMII